MTSREDRPWRIVATVIGTSLAVALTICGIAVVGAAALIISQAGNNLWSNK